LRFQRGDFGGFDWRTGINRESRMHTQDNKFCIKLPESRSAWCKRSRSRRWNS
jgi:hypothetical protein